MTQWAKVIWLPTLHSAELQRDDGGRFSGDRAPRAALIDDVLNSSISETYLTLRWFAFEPYISCFWTFR